MQLLFEDLIGLKDYRKQEAGLWDWYPSSLKLRRVRDCRFLIPNSKLQITNFELQITNYKFQIDLIYQKISEITIV